MRGKTAEALLEGVRVNVALELDGPLEVLNFLLEELLSLLIDFDP